MKPIWVFVVKRGNQDGNSTQSRRLRLKMSAGVSGVMVSRKLNSMELRERLCNNEK